MNMKRIFALAFAVLMVLALAACGTKNNDKMGDMSGNGSAMTGEPKTAEEALALHKELLERENALLSENTELWEKVFMEADKGMAMIEDGKNYGDFLLDTVEAAKEQFTDKEYEWLKEAATEISNIENKLTALEEKYQYVIFDTPPVGTFVDAAEVAAITDGTIYVIRQDFAKRNEILAAFDQLNKAEGNVIGTVMNCCETSSHDYYYSYYGGDKGQNDAAAGVNPAVGGAAATGTPAKAKRFKK